MDLPGASGIWTVGSFLLGQGVIFGGVVLNNSAQARRERSARNDDRQRVLNDRREAFELQHLMDVHGALSALLSVAQLHFVLQSSTIRGGEPPGEDERAEWELDQEAIADRAAAVAEQVAEHAEQLKTLYELLLQDQVRDKVREAVHEFEDVESAVIQPGPGSVSSRIPPLLGSIRQARSMVADRIREIYASPELPAVTTRRR
ncbi:hypothetical protein [Streptomyces sp. NPDC056255]|uniref:hypothetical protein n=1 Tax=Streptomyces sp. NPDC056255 TaxID=3345764 RepID=UPI0035DE8F5B